MTLQDSAQVSTSTHLKNEANSDILGPRTQQQLFIKSYTHAGTTKRNGGAGNRLQANKTRVHTAKT